MTGLFKAIDLFTMLSPMNSEVTPTSNPPANPRSETVQGKRSTYNGNLYIYTDGGCLSSIGQIDIWALTKTIGSNL